MASRHNLGTVISFEFWRTVKKPSFWIATLSFPLMFAVIIGIVYYSSKTSSDSSEKLAQEKFSIEYKDDSDIVLPVVAEKLEAKKTQDKQQAIEDVKSGNVDAFFYYPANLNEAQVEVYGKDSGLFNNGKYSAVAEQMLKTSASATIANPKLIAVTQGSVGSKTTTYKENGEVSAGWLAAVPPLLFLVLFYFTIAMLGNNLLNSTVEEKENRVTEMILTTLNPTVLIVGKLLATFLAGLVQAAVMITPAIIAYFVLGADVINLPDKDILSQLVFDPTAIIIGVLLMVGGLMLFTGTLVAIGAVMPTAKEAGQYFGIAIILMFVPFYIIMLILSDPNAMVVQVFTFFPYTAPVTALLRNAFGSLSIIDAAIVISSLIVLGTIIILLAVRLFRYGAMQYDGRLSLKTLTLKKR
ncbi:ABC transporter permease [Candidatus Saccharibacteria bacterium]|nr:ABC transporter permease [Candidatus Saccharibacteria bacterium]